MSRNVRKKTLLFFAVLVSLELLTRTALHLKLLNGSNHAALGSLYWELEWYRTHTFKSIFQEPLVTPIDTYDETLGWVSRPNVRNAIAFGGRVVNTNAQGFRDLKNYEYHPQSRRPKVVILGDSFTFGEEVHDFQSYPAQLQMLLPFSEIYNVSVHGYGIDQIYLLFKLKAKTYRPTHVVLGFTEVDVERTLLSFRDFRKPFFELENGELQLKGVPIPSPRDVFLQAFLTPKLFVSYEILWKKLTFDSKETEERAWKLSEALLLALKKEVEEGGAAFSIVYLPVGEELNSPTPTPSENRLLSLCEKHQISSFSLGPRVREALGTGRRYRTTGHWPPDLHELAAKELQLQLAKAHPILENSKSSH